MSCATSSSPTPRWARWPVARSSTDDAASLFPGCRPDSDRGGDEPRDVVLGRATTTYRTETRSERAHPRCYRQRRPPRHPDRQTPRRRPGDRRRTQSRTPDRPGADAIVSSMAISTRSRMRSATPERTSMSSWTTSGDHRPATRSTRSSPPYRRQPDTPLIQVGSVAGPESSIPSAALRATRLQLIGSGQGSVPRVTSSPNSPNSPPQSPPTPSPCTPEPFPSNTSNRHGPTPRKPATGSF